MKPVTVRYKVRADQGKRNEELVKRVYEELHQTAPAGFHYATFVQEDGVSFVHVAWTEREEGPSPLMEVPAFRAFVDKIEERCEEPPVTSHLREVGSYAFWDHSAE